MSAPLASAGTVAVGETSDLAVAVRAAAVALRPVGLHANHLLGVEGTIGSFRSACLVRSELGLGRVQPSMTSDEAGRHNDDDPSQTPYLYIQRKERTNLLYP